MELNQGSENMTYVSIFDGKFEVKVKEGTPNSVSRVNKDGKTIHALIYKDVSGVIVDIKKEIKEHQGKKFSSMNIYLESPSGMGVLSLPYNSGTTSAFYHMIENVDLSKPVVFSASKDKEKDKTSLFMSQDKENVKWKYTLAWKAANPTLPQKPDWKQVTVKGELVWDNTDEVLFFENIMKTKILPVLRAKKEQAAATAADDFAKDNNVHQPAAQPATTHEPSNNNPADDLPF